MGRLGASSLLYSCWGRVDLAPYMAATITCTEEGKPAMMASTSVPCASPFRSEPRCATAVHLRM